MPRVVFNDDPSRWQASQRPLMEMHRLVQLSHIPEGLVLRGTDRRTYIHHLSEVPSGEVYQTPEGNELQRVSTTKVSVAGTEIQIGQHAVLVPTANVIAQIPNAAFAEGEAQDTAGMQLLERGKAANAQSDFALACACFEGAYALSIRGGMLVSAANMRLKLGDAETAAAMYKSVLADQEALTSSEREHANRKLAEAQRAVGARIPPGYPPGSLSRSHTDLPQPHSFGSPSSNDWDAFGDGSHQQDGFEDLGNGADWGAFEDAPKRPSVPAGAAVLAPSKPVEAVAGSFRAFDAGFGEEESFHGPPGSGGGTGGSTSGGTGGGTGGGTSGELADMQARLARLEHAMAASSGPGADSSVAAASTASRVAERVEELSATVDKKLKGMKSGLEALHGRLQAVELAIGKLPEHLKVFKAKQKELSRISREHAEQIAAIHGAMPQLTLASEECTQRLSELEDLSSTLAAGPEAIMQAASTKSAAKEDTDGPGATPSEEAGDAVDAAWPVSADPGASGGVAESSVRAASCESLSGALASFGPAPDFMTSESFASSFGGASMASMESPSASDIVGTPSEDTLLADGLTSQLSFTGDDAGSHDQGVAGSYEEPICNTGAATAFGTGNYVGLDSAFGRVESVQGMKTATEPNGARGAVAPSELVATGVPELEEMTGAEEPQPALPEAQDPFADFAPPPNPAPDLTLTADATPTQPVDMDAGQMASSDNDPMSLFAAFNSSTENALLQAVDAPAVADEVASLDAELEAARRDRELLERELLAEGFCSD